MAGICAVMALVGACIAVAFGVVRLFPAYRRCADLSATRPIRDAAFVAQARVEIAASNWTQADEDLYQQTRARYYRRLELAASRRGDLLAVAEFADRAEARS